MEVLKLSTNPLNPDTNGDGLLDDGYTMYTMTTDPSKMGRGYFIYYKLDVKIWCQIIGNYIGIRYLGKEYEKKVFGKINEVRLKLQREKAPSRKAKEGGDDPLTVIQPSFYY